MKKDEKSLNKGDIIQAVRAKGFSARKAAKAVNAVFDSWQFALWCGEEVEVPGGILQAKITKGKEQMSVIEFQDVNTKEPVIRTVRYPGRRRVVKLTPDPELVMVVDPPPPPSPPPPPPPPPKKETSEEVEERQLVTDLLKLDKPADDKTMLTIREAVGAHPRIPGGRLPYKPGALLRRLRQFKAQGRRFYFAVHLAQEVSEYHWL